MDFSKVSTGLLTALLSLRCIATSAGSSSIESSPSNLASAISTNLVSGFYTSVPTPSPTPANPTQIPYFTDSADSIRSGSREYSFNFPKYNDDQYHDVFNYKDTIQLSWTTYLPGNPPTLQINCWNRTEPPNSYPLWAARVFDFSQDIPVSQALYNVTGDNTTTFSVPLALYQAFNPCQFALVDSVNKSLTRGLCVSSDFVILEDHTAPAIIWNASSILPQTTTSTWTASNASSPDWWSEFGGDLPMKSGGAMKSGAWMFTTLSGLVIATWLL